jgi:hypothetical protein
LTGSLIAGKFALGVGSDSLTDAEPIFYSLNLQRIDQTEKTGLKKRFGAHSL